MLSITLSCANYDVEIIQLVSVTLYIMTDTVIHLMYYCSLILSFVILLSLRADWK